MFDVNASVFVDGSWFAKLWAGVGQIRGDHQQGLPPQMGESFTHGGDEFLWPHTVFWILIQQSVGQDGCGHGNVAVLFLDPRKLGLQAVFGKVIQFVVVVRIAQFFLEQLEQLLVHRTNPKCGRDAQLCAGNPFTDGSVGRSQHHHSVRG